MKWKAVAGGEAWSGGRVGEEEEEDEEEKEKEIEAVGRGSCVMFRISI